MGAKLFAFLGITNYTETEYFMDDGLGNRRSCKTAYTQEALVELLDENELEVIVFMTDAANTNNWIPVNNKGLKSRLDNRNIKYKAVRIPDGKSNDEIWKIFEAFYQEIGAGDRIYVDVTQSFRSIPIIFMPVLNHAKITKKCDIRRILYGAWEATSNEMTPIFDLTLFNEILEWSSGVEQLLSTGESRKFASVVTKSINPILRETKGKDELMTLTRKCAKAIDEFYTDLKLVRGQSLQEDGIRLKELLVEIKRLNTKERLEIQPFYNLLEKIDSQLEFFDDDNLIKNTLECAKLCKDFGQYQQAYTLLLENIVSYVCVKANLNWTVHDPDRRLAENIIRSKYIDKIELSEEEKNIVEEKLKNFSTEMAVLHQNLGKFRNDLNHAQFRKDCLDTNKIVNRLDLFITKFESLYL